MISVFISSSALILSVLMLRRLFGPRLSARARYAIWAVVLLRLAIPFSIFTSPVSVMNAAERIPAVQYAELLRHFDYISLSAGGTVEAYYSSDYMHDFPTAIAENQTEADFNRMESVLRLREGFAPVRTAVTIVLMLVFAVSSARFSANARRGRKRIEAEDCPLPVYVSDGVATPCLYGAFRPVIYVTPSVANDNAMLRHTLAHETAHFMHGDHFWSLARCLCLAFHWYNPLVWIAASISRRDAEAACDEAVCRRLTPAERKSYGSTLISLTCRRRFTPFDATTTMTGGLKEIRERIELIAEPRRTSRRAVCVLLLCMALILCSAFTGAPEAELSGESVEYAQVYSGGGLEQISCVLDKQEREELAGYLPGSDALSLWTGSAEGELFIFIATESSEEYTLQCADSGYIYCRSSSSAALTRFRSSALRDFAERLLTEHGEPIPQS